MTPFDLRGPDFLQFYGFLALCVASLAYLLRQQLRQPADEPDPEALQLTPYEAAYLAGQEELAVNAVLANLVRQEVVKINAKERSVARTRKPLPTGADPLEGMFYQAIRPEGTPIKDVRGLGSIALDPIRNSLKRLGLILTDQQAWSARFMPMLLLLILGFFAIVKIAVGIERNRPVGFLLLTCIATFAVAFIGFGRRPHRSQRGDHALARLKAEHAELRYTARSGIEALAGTLPMAVALFGLGILSGTALADLQTALKPPPSAGGSCGGGCGGGCGGCGGGCGGCGG